MTSLGPDGAEAVGRRGGHPAAATGVPVVRAAMAPVPAQAVAGWPPSVFAGGDEAWREYLRELYYLGGMLYAAGLGDNVIAALASVARHGLPALPGTP
jgi:hypothetical protein